jgi:hypothetical protein
MQNQLDSVSDRQTSGSAAECNDARDRVGAMAGEVPRQSMCWGGLGCRDSNPNYLIQSQASYR